MRRRVGERIPDRILVLRLQASIETEVEGASMSELWSAALAP